jgi:hypothetical protein
MAVLESTAEARDLACVLKKAVASELLSTTAMLVRKAARDRHLAPCARLAQEIFATIF